MNHVQLIRNKRRILSSSPAKSYSLIMFDTEGLEAK
jgi:hypothetical protein